MSEASWAIAYHTNSTARRSRKWYYVARMIRVDDQWFELYRSDIICSDYSRQRVREAALNHGYELLHGLFYAPPLPRHGNAMLWSLEENQEAA
jgi:hypothetical protein